MWLADLGGLLACRGRRRQFAPTPKVGAIGLLSIVVAVVVVVVVVVDVAQLLFLTVRHCRRTPVLVRILRSGERKMPTRRQLVSGSSISARRNIQCPMHIVSTGTNRHPCWPAP